MDSINSESEARQPLATAEQILIRLQPAQWTRDLALFNRATDITRPSERFEFSRATSNI